MGSLKDDLLGSIGKHKNQMESATAMLIEQRLNKLFYLDPNTIEESKFVRLVLSKNGYDHERAGLHASALIVGEKDFCFREQVLSLYYKQIQGRQIMVKLKRIFEEGNSIHEKWQRLFIRGELADKNDCDRTRYLEDICLSYTPDICPALINGKEYVVEIKSVNTYQFKNMTEHPSGMKQLQFYMYLTGMKRGFVLAEDKNTQDFKIFAYDFNKDVVLPFIERIEAIKTYKKELEKNKKMPARICGSSNCKRAESCAMKDACFNVGMGRIKLDGR